MERLDYLKKIEAALVSYPVVALLGPRQVGKTTLAREIFQRSASKEPSNSNYFDLENPQHAERLKDPMLTFDPLEGLVIIDEIQRLPEIFPVLRVIVDRPKNKIRFLILGSASVELIKQSSESLAGRIKFVGINPFDLAEVSGTKIKKLWLRGGYPRSFLADSDDFAFDWLEQYIRTFLERDIPQLGFNIPAQSMRRFWMMLAHFHGQQMNYAEIARSLDVSEATIRRYLDILVGTFMVRRLQPWHINIDKRQIKTPKIYFNDSGLYHQLAGVSNESDLLNFPRMGASWEGFALEQVLRISNTRPEDAYFWGIHQQAEVDLLIRKKAEFVAFEFKHTLKPTITKTMSNAIQALGLKSLTIIYPGDTAFHLSREVVVRPLSDFAVSRDSHFI